MTSSGPYTEAFNYRQMFDIQDLRGKLPLSSLNPSSIAGYIDNNPKLSFFNHLIKKANKTNELNDPLANRTMFIPLDNLLSPEEKKAILSADGNTALHYLASCSLKNIIPSDLLRESGCATYYTLNRPNNIFVNLDAENFLLNHRVSIVSPDIHLSNGLIHLTNGLLTPLFSTELGS